MYWLLLACVLLADDLFTLGRRPALDSGGHAAIEPSSVQSVIIDWHSLSVLSMPGLCVRRRYLLQAECDRQSPASHNQRPGAECGERAL